MNNADEIKKLICDAIDNNAEKIIAIAKHIGENPELGFKEYNTSKIVEQVFKELGLKYKSNLALTGVKGKLKETTGSVNVAIIGEMDGIPCLEHPFSNKDTGASHACGHNLQIAALMGAAMGLKLSNACDDLDGNVTFFAVPSEEFIEIEYRDQLRSDGKIHFLGGKQELIYKGEFDDIDMSLMFHSYENSPGPTIAIGETGNGFIVKKVQYTGKVAHAAQAPDEGVNALNAAMLGIMGINALRETFRDDEHIRVHPIITKGGTAVNSVPDDVRLETYVRGKTVEAMEKTDIKVERALKGGAYAIGADVKISTIPGYLPIKCSKEFNDLLLQNAKNFEPEVKLIKAEHFNASSDFGDICHLMPAVHPFIGGVSGALHTKEFKVEDYYAACILPAKFLATTIVDLLINNADKAKGIISNYKPEFTKVEYIEFMNKYFS
ncbi:amidohydrolase [Clostridium sp.]|uniref:amidohydrolase n=1 Tax=Clostridium sp. TaxID=1506 RepID=UPI001A5DD53B|nr:amidohydrolase [Clostridium sp.]MBK5236799.1 amidohydrolase [Clostridium sp.]